MPALNLDVNDPDVRLMLLSLLVAASDTIPVQANQQLSWIHHLPEAHDWCFDDVVVVRCCWLLSNLKTIFHVFLDYVSGYQTQKKKRKKQQEGSSKHQDNKREKKRKPHEISSQKTLRNYSKPAWTFFAFFSFSTATRHGIYKLIKH
jgi:hypothetical protein